MRFNLLISLLLLPLLLTACGPRHIPTPEEQMVNQGYALKDNPRWNRHVRGILHDYYHAQLSDKGVLLENFYVIMDQHSPAIFAVGSNRHKKVSKEAALKYYLSELSNLKNMLNSGETAKGVLLSTHFDETTLRYSNEFLYKGYYQVMARVFTEKGWIFAQGLCNKDDERSIMDIRQYFTSITLAPHLEYVKPPQQDPSL